MKTISIARLCASIFRDQRGTSKADFALVASLIAVAAASSFLAIKAEVNESYYQSDAELHR